jgi:hypothetical protein
MSALLYLQTAVSSVTDHSNEAEAMSFRSCMAHLLAAPRQPAAILTSEPMDEDTVETGGDDDAVPDETHEERMVASPDSGPRWPVKEADAAAVDQATYEQRTKVFESLLRFFSPADRQPAEDVVDIVRWEADEVMA